MKALVTILLLTHTLVLAELPNKRNPMELRSLWENSPFTVKPAIESAKNELEDWTLAGVSSNSSGGYMITIVNKKDRSDRRRIHSSGQNSEGNVDGYNILEVAQGGLDYKKTKVKLSIDGQEGWVTYDEKLLAIKPAPPISSRPPAQPRPTAATSSGSQTPQKASIAPPKNTPLPASKRPRIRRVAPPSP